MIRRRLQSTLLGIVAALLALAATAVPTQLTALAAGQPNTGLLRVAYFSPDGPNVDVYIDGGRILSNVVYKTVGTYQALAVGAHRVDFRPAGAAAGSPAAASVTVNLSPGAYYTAVAGGRASQLTAVAFSDGFTPPAAGKAELRALQMAPEVPTVDIAIQGGPVIFSGVGFPEATSYSVLPSGSYNLEFRAAGTDQVLLTARGVTIKAGAVESLVGVGGAGRPVELVQVQDAAAATAAVSASGAGIGGLGGASTGLGGMAPPDLQGMLQLGAVLVIFGTLLWVVRRRTA